MKHMEVRSKCQLSESIFFHCTKHNFMDMQKPGPRGRSSSINPGTGAAVECKTPGVARGGGMLVLGIDWCIRYTDYFLGMQELFWRCNSPKKTVHLIYPLIFYSNKCLSSQVFIGGLYVSNV